MGEFRGVSLKKRLVDKIEEDITTNKNSPLYGKYRSNAEFVSEAIRIRMLLLNLQQIMPLRRCLTCIQTLPTASDELAAEEVAAE